MTSTAAPLRVVIAEDSVLIREGISRLIEESGAPSWRRSATVRRSSRQSKHIGRTGPSVTFGCRPASATRQGAPRSRRDAAYPAPRSSLLSQYVERQYATELLADGGVGIGDMLNDRFGDTPEFMDALRRVAGGGTALDAEVVAQLMVRDRADDPLSALTPRERSVLAAMAEGRTNVGIAKQLNITEGATKKHISNIFGNSSCQRTTAGACSRS